MAEPLSQLPYADHATRWGVTCDQDDSSIRIIAPPLRKLRYLPMGFKIGFGYVLFLNLMLTMAFIVNVRDRFGISMNLLFYGVILTALLAYAYRKLCYSTVLELDSSYLSISRLAGEQIILIRRWPRSRIGTIKLNHGDGTLLIHVTGVTLQEYRISGDPQVTDWIAQQLQNALSKLPAGPQQPERSDEIPPPLQKGNMRTGLLVLAFFFASIGLVLICFGMPWAALGFVAFLLAATPAGIALGTQKKDYFQ